MQHYHQGTFATSTTGFFAAVSMLATGITSHAPPWSLVPALVLSIASLITAAISGRKYLDARRAEAELHAQRLRHADEAQAARLARISLYGCDFEPLDARP